MEQMVSNSQFAGLFVALFLQQPIDAFLKCRTLLSLHVLRSSISATSNMANMI